MEAEVVCGLDVHRSVLVGSLRQGGRVIGCESFQTNRGELKRLDEWLKSHDCTTVGMEATGVYWKPVYHALEAGRRIVVANPQHIKAMKGRKTDRADAAWIARKLEDEDGIRPSFVPAREVRETRELVRGKLKQKVERMRLALEMPLTEAQQWELRAQLRRHQDVESEVQKVAQELVQRLKGMEAEVCRLMSIPGIGEDGARLLLGFFGNDLSLFPSDGHFSAWIGLSPGDNESAGKRSYAGRRKGNRFLQGKFTQFAWAAVRTKGCWLQHKYRSLCGRMPKQKAITAIAHKLAVIVYHVIKDGTEYKDHGLDYIPGARKAGALRKAIVLIQRHGGTVQLEQSHTIETHPEFRSQGFTG